MIPADIRLWPMIATGFVSDDVKTYISSCQADGCDATAERLSETGECLSIPADLASMEGIQSLVEELGKRENKFDSLINNAGAI